MKRTTSLILSLIMLLSVTAGLNLTAFADTEGDFTYSVKDGKATVTGYDGNAQELEIPATLGGKDVIAIGDSVFDANKTLKKVIIPEGITKIGDSAFYDCENLERVDIPFSVTTISDWAFKGCKSLKRAFIRGAVSTIGESMFLGCEGLTAISVPSSLTEIGESAFRGCTSLKEIYYADSFSSFYDDVSISSVNNDCLYSATLSEYSLAGNCGDDVYYVFNTDNDFLYLKGTGATDNYSFDYPGFYDYRDLILVTIVEEGITFIDDGIFYNFANMLTVSLPESLTEIGEAAFKDCVSLKGINIPRNVKKIQSLAFTNCEDLTKVNVYSYSVNIEAMFTALATIYACKGSTAEAYAEKYDYEFISIGHNWSEWNIIEDEIEPTCTVPGTTALRYHECVICGAGETDGGYPIDPYGHILGEGVITKYPTPTETGLIEFTCEECGEKEIKIVAKCEKYANTLTAKGKSVSVKANKKSTVKKAKAFSIQNAKGKVTFKKAKGNKKITVSKNGKITVKKGLKKGTYKVKVKVTAAGDETYTAKTETVTVKIIVK